MGINFSTRSTPRELLKTTFKASPDPIFQSMQENPNPRRTWMTPPVHKILRHPSYCTFQPQTPNHRTRHPQKLPQSIRAKPIKQCSPVTTQSPKLSPNQQSTHPNATDPDNSKHRKELAFEESLPNKREILLQIRTSIYESNASNCTRPIIRANAKKQSAPNHRRINKPHIQNASSKLTSGEENFALPGINIKTPQASRDEVQNQPGHVVPQPRLQCVRNLLPHRHRQPRSQHQVIVPRRLLHEQAQILGAPLHGRNGSPFTPNLRSHSTSGGGSVHSVHIRRHAQRQQYR